MGTRHVTELLSGAYDETLSAAERRRYEDHVAACTECAADAERFRQSIDAVRELPVARMPQRVVLPSTPPQVERRRGFALPLLGRLHLPQVSPAWSAAGLGLAGIAAVVLAVHVHSGNPSTTASTARPDALTQLNPGGNAASVAGGAAQKRATAGIGTCPLPLAVVPQTGSAPSAPQGFDNRTTESDAHRPGQNLVLATTATHFSPGSQVLIYAALTTSTGQHTSVIPCVTLHDQGALALGTSGGTANESRGGGGPPAAGPGTASPPPGGPAATPCPSACPAPQAVMEAPVTITAPYGADYGPNGTLLSPDQVHSFSPYSLLPPLAVASPTSAVVSNLPLQVIRIPSNATPGTHLQLVALIPSGLPGTSDSPALEAVLTIDVS